MFCIKAKVAKGGAYLRDTTVDVYISMIYAAYQHPPDSASLVQAYTLPLYSEEKGLSHTVTSGSIRHRKDFMTLQGWKQKHLQGSFNKTLFRLINEILH